MQFVALEWDHHIGRPMVGWIVVECARLEQKFGGPQAMPPRRDVAYFCDPVTARRDARLFAEMRNRHSHDYAGFEPPSGSSVAHAAFAWDHQIFSPLIKWAVLKFNNGGQRDDVAYFLDPLFAEQDARHFRSLRDIAECLANPGSVALEQI